MSSRKTALIVAIAVLGIAILGLVGWLVWNTSKDTNRVSEITTFEQCKVAEGSKLLETFPEQCVTVDGRTFVGQNVQTDN